MICVAMTTLLCTVLHPVSALAKLQLSTRPGQDMNIPQVQWARVYVFYINFISFPSAFGSVGDTRGCS